MNFETRAVHAGRKTDPTTGSIIPPLYQTATYVLEEVGKLKGFDYTRSANPTRENLEVNLASLEGGKYATAFASGMAAADSVIRLLKAHDHIVSVDDIYGGVIRLLDNIVIRSEISVDYVDGSNLQNIRDAIKPETRMLWIETPSNPLLKIIDLEEAAQIAQEHNLIYVVDSTFATPYLLRPLEFGADIVIQSTTKYLSGHNQLIGGACITNREDLHEDLFFIQKTVGAVPSPHDCWLTLLGIKTLPLRMEKHCENAQLIAEYLEQHDKVQRVAYPGLPSHPQHNIARSQQNGYGGMITLELKGGYDAGVKFLNSLSLISLAESLGSVESMITHPASMTHKSVPREDRLARGLTDGLARISVGIESLQDLIEDLKQALSQVKA
ncbi:MAG: Cystathionine beta-lyase [Candidatus Moanabacter tarae]|uniref:Cystathionine beta-lyase n=1 Tax=Candidatus Moanibacter tarae TaxID=2200854 RepID=A0A2Z4ADW6_9BACT|nr:MAG: Cystathionine beta-lyase [Candidatus Moanabacter tarae]|tara:strand:- start:9830 stop:10978 length:1149 start_codon:yes stop_codon:yes gene_type:complete